MTFFIATNLHLSSQLLIGAIDIGLLFMQLLLFSVSIFLILLVLVQRGKGGGLTGALGGMGGQSAFGSRAGDAFTKITVVTAVIWITLCMITIARFNPPPRPTVIAPDAELQSEDGAGGLIEEAGEFGGAAEGASETSDNLPVSDAAPGNGSDPATTESGTGTSENPATEPGNGAGQDGNVDGANSGSGDGSSSDGSLSNGSAAQE